MSYRMVYGPTKQEKPSKVRPFLRMVVLTGLFFLFFVLGVQQFWPEGYAILEDLVSLNHLADTGTALENLVEQVKSGITLQEAFALFCREIMENSMVAG